MVKTAEKYEYKNLSLEEYIKIDGKIKRIIGFDIQKDKVIYCDNKKSEYTYNDIKAGVILPAYLYYYINFEDISKVIKPEKQEIIEDIDKLLDEVKEDLEILYKGILHDHQAELRTIRFLENKQRKLEIEKDKLSK